MRSAKYLVTAAAFLLLISAGAFAKDKAEHNVKLDRPVQVGSAVLQPGQYKVEWHGTGQAVPIQFVQDGKTVLSTKGRVIEMQKPAQADEVTMRKTSSNKERLEELDFGNRKEALRFTSHGAGM